MNIVHFIYSLSHENTIMFVHVKIQEGYTFMLISKRLCYA